MYEAHSMTIPLTKLNCTYCGLFKNNRCSLAVIGKEQYKERPPEKQYCFHIFENFQEGGHPGEDTPIINIDFKAIEKEARKFLSKLDGWAARRTIKEESNANI